MPRLIILLLTLASLTIVTVQNLGEEKAVPLVVLGAPVATIPLGLLLLAAVGIGALMTLILYGLLGVRRSPESKYKPMGSRVPYSDSRTTPPSDTAPAAATSSSQYGSVSSGSSAFVTEPPVDSAGASPTSPPPASRQSSSFVSTPDKPTDSPPGSSSGSVYSPFSRSGSSSDSTARAAADEKKKPSRRVESPDPSERTNNREGQDWGEMRTAVQRNSWEAGGESASRFVGDRAVEVDEDLDQGWERFDDYTEYDQSRYPSPDSARDDYGRSGYQRKVYGDDLYGVEDPAYDQEPFDEGPEELDSDQVYEADYRVIVPPSRSLEDDETY